MSIELLDNCLFEALNYLKDQWYNNNVGIVACCLSDKDKKVFSTSTRIDNNQFWTHAERNAYNKFQSQYDEPSKDAIFIVTLSPCIKALDRRKDNSCTDFMLEKNIKRVHFGVLDTFHVETIADYAKLGINASVTLNNDLAVKCKTLMNLFSKYKSRLSTDMLQVKIEQGSEFLS